MVGVMELICAQSATEGIMFIWGLSQK